MTEPASTSPPEAPRQGLTPAAAARRAARAATHIERQHIRALPGLVAAVPVAGVLLIGTAVGQPVGAVTMGAGAMISGVAWRGGGGPVVPPLGTMAAAAGGLTVATLAGTLSGGLPWLHLGFLALFALSAGLASCLGRRGNVVGIQTVIAFVVFGRFPEGLSGAMTLAALVLAGAVTQISFAALVGRPPAWRRQRGSVARAYHTLSVLARNLGASSIEAAAALDDAAKLLSGPSLFADPAAMTLSTLVEEGYRIRLELIGLASTGGNARDSSELRRGLEEASELMELIALVTESRKAGDQELSSRAANYLQLAESAGASREDATELVMRQLSQDRRLAALAGQVRAAARLASERTELGASWRRAHPTLGTHSELEQIRSDLRRLRDSASIRSVAGRHAVRLAFVACVAELLEQRTGLPRGYWSVIAAVTVLRPEFGATFTRGAERILGTLAGVLVASLIAVALQPGGWAITAAVALLAWFTYTVFPASFAAGTAGITAVVVFLLHPVAPSSVTIAFDRGIDTVIGGAIGLVAYASWPTWSDTSIGPLFGELVEAQRRYLQAVMNALVLGTEPTVGRFRPLARGARRAYGEAEGAVSLLESEPVHEVNPADARATLLGLRRLVYAIHALRAELVAEAERGPRHPAEPVSSIAPLSQAMDETLRRLRERLLVGEPARNTTERSQLRDLYRAAREDPDFRLEPEIQVSLDELIDAVDSLGC